MHDCLPLLQSGTFPPLTRNTLDTIQVNMGYRCNMSCTHCHVAASPQRTEMLQRDTMNDILAFIKKGAITTLDLTGGAPEMNPLFREFVTAVRVAGVHVIDRCNLSILNEPGYEEMAEFLASQQVEIVASLPCYLEENVDKQRGSGAFQASLRGLEQLNALGYGMLGSGLSLNLVYNPTGIFLPPEQSQLEEDYQQQLKQRYDIHFNHLFTITNVPIKRFGSWLQSRGEFEQYMQLLRQAYRPENAQHVMCRSLISIDWQGYVYDCDFNQMLNLNLADHSSSTHIAQLKPLDLQQQNIATRDHCYACTAGQGSSCAGAL
ncbi:MAG: arsenosugar biosynthesis radical SAM protein ArsS [Mariprofundaceae bacterium]|nr:arsenosugar biosynthesis radical SAM protein ArsS [Mariprofundaceae bacterium]